MTRALAASRPATAHHVARGSERSRRPSLPGKPFVHSIRTARCEPDLPVRTAVEHGGQNARQVFEIAVGLMLQGEVQLILPRRLDFADQMVPEGVRLTTTARRSLGFAPRSTAWRRRDDRRCWSWLGGT